jgi:hypothetical protein
VDTTTGRPARPPAFPHHRGVAQMAERLNHDQQVGDSIAPAATCLTANGAVLLATWP